MGFRNEVHNFVTLLGNQILKDLLLSLGNMLLIKYGLIFTFYVTRKEVCHIYICNNNMF